jgi:aquaporin Z
MNHDRLAPLTGFFAGILVATYVIVEAPFSGFGMNPARTFASALPAWLWTSFWLYMIAPPVGMLLAAELYVRIKGIGAVICANLHHHNAKRCIFHCGYAARS